MMAHCSVLSSPLISSSTHKILTIYVYYDYYVGAAAAAARALAAYAIIGMYRYHFFTSSHLSFDTETHIRSALHNVCSNDHHWHRLSLKKIYVN